ncbi:helix-turn-helix transcriptional regulator [Streptomyces sp. NPDC053782]|uniref:helix-turn-helix domain-containing protein n=1 Tax=Streptomyces sp. NPDC053782 TaxID=3155535 RepID=UPI00341A22C0
MPEELDPQIKEFTGQLRRLVDRSELSVASVADATGYSKTSWERYLNGRLLAPKGAIIALAEVTGTNPLHGLAGYRGPAPTGDRTARPGHRAGTGAAATAMGPAATPGPAAPEGRSPSAGYGEPPRGGPGSRGRSGGGGSRRMTTFVAVTVGDGEGLVPSFFLSPSSFSRKKAPAITTSTPTTPAASSSCRPG